MRDREGYRSRNRKVGFKNSRGVTLAGSLHLPKEAPTGSVVLAHSFTSSRNLKIVARLAACLAEGRWAVLRFDFTGLGDSEGRFEESCLSENIDDVGAAVEWVTERFPGECLLGGHSLGGATAVLAAVGLEAVTAVASLAAPSDTAHLMRLFSRKALQTIRREGSASIPVAGRSVRIGRRFVEDLSRHRVAEAAAQLARPLLVLHGTEDRVVDIREGEKLFAAAHQPKAFVPLVGADHLMTDRRYARRVATVLSLWWCDFEPPGEVP